MPDASSEVPASPRPRRGLGFSVLLFVFFWLVLLISGRSAFIRDPGTFWHTVVGERIFQEGFFNTDPFSFTHHGRHWVAHEWVGEVLMAAIHRIGGFDSLVAVATAIVAAIFTGLTVRLWRTGLHPILVFGIVALVFAASSLHFHVRPHLMTMAGVVLTMILLIEVEAGRARLGRLWWLVPLFWVWSNTHGGVIGGYAMLGFTGVGWLVRFGSPLRSLRDVLEVLVIGLCCFATSVATPYGADILWTWVDIMNSPLLKKLIVEHAAPDYSDLRTWPVVGLSLLYLFLLAGIPPRQWRISWLIPLLWMVQAFLRVRHGPLFAMSAVVAMADLWPQTRWSTWLARSRPDYYLPQGVDVAWGWRGFLMAFVLVVGVLGLHAAQVSMPIVGRGWTRLDSNYWPSELIATLRKHEPPPGQEARLFNDVLDGGFVIYYGPRYRNFVDDRCELYGEQWLLEVVKAGMGNSTPVIEKWEREFGTFDFALTRTGKPFDDHFREHPEIWEVIERTPTATFYRRKSAD
jgi:hypothetical protein